MRRHASIWLGCVLAASGVGLRARTALAANAEAMVGNNNYEIVGFNKGNGTTSVSAYSMENGDVNQTINATVTLGAVGQNVGNTSPLPTYGTNNTAPKIGALGPAYGIVDRSSGITYKLDKADLTKANDGYTIESETGVYRGLGKAGLDENTKGQLIATAGGGGKPGAAAGRATDPFSIPSGDYAYEPTISGSVEVDAPGETADINARWPWTASSPRFPMWTTTPTTVRPAARASGRCQWMQAP